jgi:hypothetical protein
MNVHWTKTPQYPVAGMYNYFDHNSPEYARCMVDRLTRRSEQIATFPQSCRIVPEYRFEQIRETIEGVAGAGEEDYAPITKVELWSVSQAADDFDFCSENDVLHRCPGIGGSEFIQKWGFHAHRAEPGQGVQVESVILATQ